MWHVVRDTRHISRVIPCLFAHSDPLTSLGYQWMVRHVTSDMVTRWPHGIIPLTTCPHHRTQCLTRHWGSSVITSWCVTNFIFSASFEAAAGLIFWDQFRLFSVSLQPLQSHFSREVIWEDDILVSVDTTYREIVSKISFIASNSAHNWLLDLEHTRQHVQKFLGSVNKYLISQNIYMSIIYVRIYFPLKIRLLWKLETRSLHISDYWGQVNYATRGSYEVWDVSRDTRDTATPGDTPCHGSRHAARDTFLTVTILSPKSDDDSRFSPLLLSSVLYLWTSAVTFIKLQ